MRIPKVGDHVLYRFDGTKDTLGHNQHLDDRDVPGTITSVIEGEPLPGVEGAKPETTFELVVFFNPKKGALASIPAAVLTGKKYSETPTKGTFRFTDQVVLTVTPEPAKRVAKKELEELKLNRVAE